MKTRRIFTFLYFAAIVFIVLFVAKDHINISEDLADIFYYAALGIFGIGLVRIFFLILKRK
jgi:hypothetical protein